MSSQVISPFHVFTGRDGKPLESGFIYIGEVNQNPETSPVAVFWDEDLTIPAAQPIRTIGGYPSRGGTPGIIYTQPIDYSVTVRDKKRLLVFSKLSATSLTELSDANDPAKGAAQIGRGVQAVNSIADLRLLLKTSPSQYARVDGYYARGDGGGGNYWLDESDTTSVDNGGTVIVAADGARWKLVAIEDIRAAQFGSPLDGSADGAPQIEIALDDATTLIGDGTITLDSGILITTPGRFSGNGARTKLQASVSFAAEPIITLSPDVGSDPKDWIIENMIISNAGSATSVFKLDIATAGKYISKLQFRGIISQNQTSAHFVELVNPVNVDGLFTSVFEDNWSFGGYHLDNIGDSVIFQRNTVTGAGLGYYVSQLPTASHIIIRDGNNTSSGGALGVEFGLNVTFDNMQCELPVAFTGLNNAVVWANNDGSALVTNLRITNCNINTQGNTTNCIYLNNTDAAVIDGCSLFCHPTLGQHITLGANARNTYIGNNKYFSSVDGTEISPRIVNGGTGTQGIFVAATLATWMSLVDPANGFSAGFTKSRDGLITLRGNLAGAASGAGQTLYTLPLGFRPVAKVVTFAAYANGAPDSHALMQVLPTGEVQFVTVGATTVYLDGASFSIK